MSSFSFVHTADLHLGYKQYGLMERFRDYGDVFSEVAEYAIQKDNDFFLICGDVFDDRNIDASTFSQAHAVLKKLNKNDIKVFVIEGNHDKAYYNDGMSWLEALDHQGLLELIRVKSSDGLDVLGDYREFNVGGELVRVFGVKYVGARTKELFSKVEEDIRGVIDRRGSADFTILMMHFGLSDQVDMDLGRGYSFDKLIELKEVVDYFALGHYHLPYSVDDWVYNPGSLETTKKDEVGYPNGFFSYRGGEVEFVEVERNRLFMNIRVDLGKYRSKEEVLDKLREEKEKLSDGDYLKEPIVSVSFEGDLNFRREDLPVDEAKEIFSEDALYINISIKGEKEDIDFDEFERNKKEEIEKRVLERLVERNRPIYRNKSDLISETLLDIKEMVANDKNNKELIDAVKDCFKGLDSGEGEIKSSDGGNEWNWREAYQG